MADVKQIKWDDLTKDQVAHIVRRFAMDRRTALLQELSGIETFLDIEPSTADIRKWWRERSRGGT